MILLIHHYKRKDFIEAMLLDIDISKLSFLPFYVSIAQEYVLICVNVSVGPAVGD